jgi:hypothetical protein
MNFRFSGCVVLMLGLSGSLASAADPAPAIPAAAAPAASAPSAELLDALKGTGLTPAKLMSGLKTGLGTAVSSVTEQLAQPDAFQLDGPSSMGKLVSLLEKSNQGGALENFKTSLNQVASSVAPQATATLKEALASLKPADAAAVAKGQPGSATAMLRQAAEPFLKARLAPLVSQAIASNGTALKAKELAAKAGPFAAFLGVPGATDLESYVTTQVIDTSFNYLAKEEAALRADPSKLKNSLAAKVFALGSAPAASAASPAN